MDAWAIAATADQGDLNAVALRAGTLITTSANAPATMIVDQPLQAIAAPTWFGVLRYLDPSAPAAGG